MLFPLLLAAQATSPAIVSPQKADTWAATDALGRSLPGYDMVGELRRDKYVGIFYFTWLGAHGHDEHSGPTPTEGVHPKDPKKTYAAPYDISQILRDDPAEPRYGPDHAFHHWGEPYFGYYLSDDEWVIAKHAQLLGDAGVDVIVFDITNGVVYLPMALRVCKVFSRLKQMGWAVPRVAFLTNSRHVETTTKLYEGFYARGLYRDLWFQWKGKPLLMGNPEGLAGEIQDFFTFRRSWAWTEGQEWFGDGKDKWPWIDHYPQQYGWHDDPNTPEQMVVSTAQHPISNIGRSFHEGHQPPADSIDSGAGWFFAEQWRRALEVDPEFIFITGWNEWVAMRFTDGKAREIMGKPVAKGETYFVDQYNEEFSRDIEPMKGGFGDNYYYQMIDGIRRFKGVRPALVISNNSITIDGDFDDWPAVRAVYYDHLGDVQPRNATGWGRIDTYLNQSGRNDLVEARVAEDENWLYFYLRTADEFVGGVVPEGLELLLDFTDSNGPRNLGFSHRLITTGRTPNTGDIYPKGDTGDPRPSIHTMLIEQARGEWEWIGRDEATVRVSGKELEVQVPKRILRSLGTELQFKWIDNVHPDGDALRFMDQGDSAPNARFNYRCRLK